MQSHRPPRAETYKGGIGVEEPTRRVVSGEEALSESARAVRRAIDGTDEAIRTVQSVKDREVADSAKAALSAARFDLTEALRRLGYGE